MYLFTNLYIASTSIIAPKNDTIYLDEFFVDCLLFRIKLNITFILKKNFQKTENLNKKIVFFVFIKYSIE